MKDVFESIENNTEGRETEVQLGLWTMLLVLRSRLRIMCWWIVEVEEV